MSQQMAQKFGQGGPEAKEHLPVVEGGNLNVNDHDQSVLDLWYFQSRVALSNSTADTEPTDLRRSWLIVIARMTRRTSKVAGGEVFQPTFSYWNLWGEYIWWNRWEVALTLCRQHAASTCSYSISLYLLACLPTHSFCLNIWKKDYGNGIITTNGSNQTVLVNKKLYHRC